jgi:hypothetical protein
VIQCMRRPFWQRVEDAIVKSGILPHGHFNQPRGPVELVDLLTFAIVGLITNFGVRWKPGRASSACAMPN